jgi:dsRNA-specific ribonuclease
MLRTTCHRLLPSHGKSRPFVDTLLLTHLFLLVRSMSTFNAEAAATNLAISFKTPGILQQALTHRSYLQGSLPTNDRLQRLGNQVVRLAVCESGVKALGLQAQKHDLRNYITKYTDSAYLANQFDTLGLNDGLRFKAVRAKKTPHFLKEIDWLIQMFG